MGYLGDGRLGDKKWEIGRIVQKILGDGRLTFSKWEQGAPFFHSKNIFKNIKFTCYIYYHLNDKSGPYP